MGTRNIPSEQAEVKNMYGENTHAHPDLSEPSHPASKLQPKQYTERKKTGRIKLPRKFGSKLPRELQQ